MYDKNKLIALAEAELGYHEKTSNAQLDDKTANSGSGNFTKYARDLDVLGNFYNGGKNGYAWCDVFVDWCFVKCFGKASALALLCQPPGSAGAGCYYSAMYYRQRGQFHAQGPQPGDQVFFAYSAGEVSHTGIVVAVSGSTVTTIEGNTSDGVYRRTYSAGNRQIYGYGRPDWGMVGPAEEEDDEPQTVAPVSDDEVTQIAREVIAGNWGNDAARVAALSGAGYDYTVIQARVNEILAGTYAPSTDPDPIPVSDPDTQAGSYTLELPELCQGMTGTAVRRVQAILIDLGYKCGGKIVSGREVPDEEFGPTTAAAVEQFQTANALTASGKIDRDTMRALLN